jgi:hypothetical protein
MWTQGPRHHPHMILLPGRLQTTEHYSWPSDGSAALQCATEGDPVAQFMSATTRPVLRCKLPNHTWPQTCVDQTEAIQAVFPCHHSRVDRRGALCARAPKAVIATRAAHGGPSERGDPCDRPPQPASESHVLGHDCDTFGMYCAVVRVLHQMHLQSWCLRSEMYREVP